MTTAIKTTFTKKDGTSREIRFIRLRDMPANRIPPRKGPAGKSRALAEGMELVWDLDAQGFRTFNWHAVTGQSVEFQVPEEELPPVQAQGAP